MDKKAGLEESRWAGAEQAEEIQRRVLEMIKDETDQRIRVWARLRLGGERGVGLAREYGYRDGSGVTQVVKRLEKAAVQDKVLARKLAQLSNEATGA